ncbi:ArgE/DapE family deacylase [Natrinema halophilum]|uniref:Probable succinyl-diaminopimelate desuccinylase n=1 Tax=Natrinema halophilum TaxID=1699371 RepID=A0A7D5KZ48_9EURY|nr:ArgE/DapE family deacylase [Natrinema halophilum]QLG48500.1 ArgE/DapE family deacylase [Natrinema halophilum]
MSTTSRQDICTHIEQNQDRMLDFLSELISAQSLPGEEQPAQEVLKDKLSEFGGSIDVWEPDADDLRDHPGFFETTPYQEHGYEGRENVATTIDGNGDGPSLAMSGHVDVVNPDPIDAWEHDPWNPDIDDGRMYGRGTMDMKGGIAAFIHAYETLRELDIELAGDLTLQTTIEEEAGGVGGVLSALERGYQPDAAIIPEPSGVPKVGVASAGVLYFRVTVPGKPAHAAYKFLGVDAVDKAFQIHQALENYNDELNERIGDYQPAVNQYAEAEGSSANLTITDIEVPGSWTSTVPGKAIMEFRMGWPPSAGMNRNDVREEITGVIDSVVREDDWLVDNQPEIEWFGWSTDPHEIDFRSDFYELVCENTTAVTGGDIQRRGGLGGNDERFYNRYYDIPCPSVGPNGGNGHGADEYVEIDSLIETAQIHALTMVNWCGTVGELE